jgi:hypothetical protein
MCAAQELDTCTCGGAVTHVMPSMDPELLYVLHVLYAIYVIYVLRVLVSRGRHSLAPAASPPALLVSPTARTAHGCAAVPWTGHGAWSLRF